MITDEDKDVVLKQVR